MGLVARRTAGFVPHSKWLLVRFTYCVLSLEQKGLLCCQFCKSPVDYLVSVLGRSDPLRLLSSFKTTHSLRNLIADTSHAIALHNLAVAWQHLMDA